MSGLTDMMAADLAAITATGYDLSVSATLQAAQSGGPTGAINIVFGDSTDSLQVLAAGVADNRAVPAMIVRSAILAILGRDLVEGDRFVVAAGANAGTWRVSASVPDEGDGVVASLRLDSHHSARKVQG